MKFYELETDPSPRYTGNLKHTFTDTTEVGEFATWRFEIDPWVWRGGLGIRFRWVPLSD